MLASAVACAANANFINVHIPDLIKAEVGESEKQLSALFHRAKMASPCVIFFDEIQAMFVSRESSEKNHDASKLTSQLLLELDQLSVSTSNYKPHVVVIAATNVPQNMDSSLLQPGRLEKVLYVAPPDMHARMVILQRQIAKMKVEPLVLEQVNDLAEKTDGYSGADLINVCMRAGLNALQESMHVSFITMQHFALALQQVPSSISHKLLHFYEHWQQK